MHGSHLVQAALHLCTYIAFHVQYVLLFLADVVLALPSAVLFQTRFTIAAAVKALALCHDIPCLRKHAVQPFVLATCCVPCPSCTQIGTYVNI